MAANGGKLGPHLLRPPRAVRSQADETIGSADSSAAWQEDLTASHRTGKRIGSLDNLKVVLVVGVILGHAAMTYGAAGTWIFEAPSYGGATLSGPVKAGANAAIVLGVFFALGLFLYVAGLFTPGSLRRKGARAFASGRLARLGIPVALYAVVVMPMLAVLIGTTVGEANTSLVSLYWASLRDPGTGPMWFVAILLVFSLIVALGAQLIGLPIPRPTQLRPSYLAAAALAITVGSFAVRLLFPIDSRQILDLHVWLWPQCAVLFALGLLSAQHGWLNPVPDRLRHWSGLVAVGALIAAVAVLAPLHPADDAIKGGATWPAMLLDVAEGAYAVGASIWILGLFQRHFAHQGKLAQWCSHNAYGAFIAQGPILVGLGLALQAIDLPADIKLVLLAAGGVALCFVAASSSGNVMGWVSARIRDRNRLVHVPSTCP
jgi:hypothetical protein